MSEDHVLDAAHEMIDGRDVTIAALRAQVAALRRALSDLLVEIAGPTNDETPGRLANARAALEMSQV